MGLIGRGHIASGAQLLGSAGAHSASQMEVELATLTKREIETELHAGAGGFSSVMLETTDRKKNKQQEAFYL